MLAPDIVYICESSGPPAIITSVIRIIMDLTVRKLMTDYRWYELGGGGGGLVTVPTADDSTLCQTISALSSHISWGLQRTSVLNGNLIHESTHTVHQVIYMLHVEAAFSS